MYDTSLTNLTTHCEWQCAFHKAIHVWCNLKRDMTLLYLTTQTQICARVYFTKKKKNQTVLVNTIYIYHTKTLKNHTFSPKPTWKTKFYNKLWHFWEKQAVRWLWTPDYLFFLSNFNYLYFQIKSFSLFFFWLFLI